jgi:hypothetical protein
MRLLLAAVLMAAACGGAAPKQISDPASGGDGATEAPVADPVPTTAGPPCAIVAERVAQVALADQPKRQPQVTEIVRKRCTEDRWSDVARNCLATVETDDELDGCRTHLSDPQQQAVERDMEAAVGTSPPMPAATKPANSSAPPPKPGTRAPTRRTGADPCEGGE